jgi:beta-glucosidase/6-phospho-beta-glucosidase/beta-galactosidase
VKLFNTFFIGGYECADMINNRRQRVDLLSATGHDKHAQEDYEMLSAAGIRTVREGIRWSVVEKSPYVYDFSEVKNRILAAQATGIQQLWDICHFGYPDGLVPMDDDFTDRLMSVCRAFTKLYRSCTEDPLIITPVNEISFLSFLSRMRGTVPFMRGIGGKIKYGLCKASIKATEAIKEIDPAAKIMLVEPLIWIHPKEGGAVTSTIRLHNRSQFEAMDIITGRMHPELGGSPQHMDIAGFNYYYQNQWEHRGRRLCWKADRQQSNFPALLQRAADRYGKPVVLSETGHFKEDRSLWMKQITDDCIEAMKMGVDLQGICIYPVLDRPDWDTNEYIDCGVWGYCRQTLKRSTDDEYLAAVRGCIEKMNSYLAARTTKHITIHADINTEAVLLDKSKFI